MTEEKIVTKLKIDEEIKSVSTDDSKAEKKTSKDIKTFFDEHFDFKDNNQEKYFKNLKLTNLEDFYSFFKTASDDNEILSLLKYSKDSFILKLLLSPEIPLFRKRAVLFIEENFQRKLKLEDIFIEIFNNTSEVNTHFYLEFLSEILKTNKELCQNLYSPNYILKKFLNQISLTTLEISKKLVYCQIILSLCMNIHDTFMVFPNTNPVNLSAISLINNIKDFKFNVGFGSDEAKFFKLNTRIIYNLLRKDTRNSWKKCFNNCDWKMIVDEKEKKFRINELLLHLLRLGNKSKLNYNVFLILKLNLTYDDISKSSFFQKSCNENDRILLKDLGKEFGISFFDSKEFFDQISKIEGTFNVIKQSEMENMLIGLEKNITNKDILNYPNVLHNLIFYNDEINFEILKKFGNLVEDLMKKNRKRNDSTSDLSILDNYQFKMFAMLSGEIIFRKYLDLLLIDNNTIPNSDVKTIKSTSTNLEIRKKKRILLQFMNYFILNDDTYIHLYFLIHEDTKLIKKILKKSPNTLNSHEIKLLFTFTKKQNSYDFFPLKEIKSFYYSNFDNNFIYRIIRNLLKNDNQRNEWRRYLSYQFDFLTILLNLEECYLKKIYKDISYIVTKIIKFDKLKLNVLTKKELRNLMILANIETHILGVGKGCLTEILSKEKKIKNYCCGCDEINVKLVCSRCKITYYCSKECQKTHWKKHKKNCSIVSFTKIKKKENRPKKKYYKKRKTKGGKVIVEVVEEEEDFGDEEEEKILDDINLDFSQAKKLKISDLPEMGGQLNANFILESIIPSKENEIIRNGLQKELETFFKNRGCQLYLYGSFSLGVYLNESDLDFTLFLVDKKKLNSDCPIAEFLCKIIDKEMNISSLQMINAQVPIIKFVYKDINIDLSFQKLNCLNVLPFLEKISKKIDKNYLFKKSIILIKNFCLNELKILNAKDGFLNSYTLTVLILAIFNLYHEKLNQPLDVLKKFINVYTSFDWVKHCATIFGILKKSKYESIEKIFKKNKKKLISYDFCEEHRIHDNSMNFEMGFINVIDPLNYRNNLGQTIKTKRNVEIIKKKMLTAEINLNMSLKQNDIRLLFPNTLKGVSDKKIEEMGKIEIGKFDYIFKKDLEEFERNLKKVQKFI